MKTPYLSTKPRFLLLIIAALLFGINQAAHAEGLSGLKESLNKGKIKQIIINKPDQQPGDVKNSSSELSSTVACRASCPRICRSGWPFELAEELAECRA